MNLGNERGSVTVQMVLAWPLLMLVLFGGMGAAMFAYGRTAALSAAQSGAVAFAAENGTQSDCELAALDLAHRIGDALSNPRVKCVRGANFVTVTVSGQVLSLVPGWQPSVEQTAQAPVERAT
jgi:Flp pilus assembly protein TadG